MALNLKRREKILISVGTIVVLTLAMGPFVRGLLEEYEVSERQLAQAKGWLSDARDWRMEIEAERSGQNAIRDRIERRLRFDLYSYTQGVVIKLGLKDRATFQSRRQASGGNLDGVQVDLSGVSMEEFVNLLHNIYAGDNLIVLQRLDHLRASKSGKGMDCQLTFVAPSAAG